MKSTFVLALLAFLVKAVRAATVDVYSPVSGSIFHAGESVQIDWTWDDYQAQIAIQIAYGAPPEYTVVSELYSDSAEQFGVAWNIPIDLPSRQDYYIIVLEGSIFASSVGPLSVVGGEEHIELSESSDSS